MAAPRRPTFFGAKPKSLNIWLMLGMRRSVTRSFFSIVISVSRSSWRRPPWLNAAINGALTRAQMSGACRGSASFTATSHGMHACCRQRTMPCFKNFILSQIPSMPRPLIKEAKALMDICPVASTCFTISCTRPFMSSGMFTVGILLNTSSMASEAAAMARTCASISAFATLSTPMSKAPQISKTASGVFMRKSPRSMALTSRIASDCKLNAALWTSLASSRIFCTINSTRSSAALMGKPSFSRVGINRSRVPRRSKSAATSAKRALPIRMSLRRKKCWSPIRMSMRLARCIGMPSCARARCKMAAAAFRLVHSQSDSFRASKPSIGKTRLKSSI
mmetsp:Transcript_226/g.540  ORF Transcript_226/g.540 Transcript_226/m.540 type:complete len:335 (+) Transcript_226:1346-2350(+)